VKSEVIDGNSVVDIFSTPLGLRVVNWDNSSRILTINGKKADLKGGNRRQDYPWLGGAVPEWLILMDMQFRDEKEGHNFVRTIYNQDNKLVYTQADKAGLIVDAELIGANNRNLSAPETEQNVREFIRSNRNHPSIVFWSFGNDAAFAAGSKTALAEDAGRAVVKGRINPDIPVALFGSVLNNS
jgi:beta-galactosidase